MDWSTDSVGGLLDEVLRSNEVESIWSVIELEFALVEVTVVELTGEDIGKLEDEDVLEMDCDVALIEAFVVDSREALELIKGETVLLEWTVALVVRDMKLVVRTDELVIRDVVLVECEVETKAPGVRYQFFGGSPKHSPTVTPFQPRLLIRL